ncbi:hypothetical protein HZS_7594 [Henneguya salminicola]|nr:hypothetical protein HZS_7594 [Henneguya salminicola]
MLITINSTEFLFIRVFLFESVTIQNRREPDYKEHDLATDKDSFKTMNKIYYLIFCKKIGTKLYWQSRIVEENLISVKYMFIFILICDY